MAGDVAELVRYVKWAGRTRKRRERRGTHPFSDLVGRAGRPRVTPTRYAMMDSLHANLSRAVENESHRRLTCGVAWARWVQDLPDK